jgi:hypothetical protein
LSTLLSEEELAPAGSSPAGRGYERLTSNRLSTAAGKKMGQSDLRKRCKRTPRNGKNAFLHTPTVVMTKVVPAVCRVKVVTDAHPA